MNEVAVMNNFMNYDFNIERIIVALFVTPHNSRKIHKDRPNHGLALIVDGNADFLFDNDKEINVQKNEIVYLPKNSNYTVTGIDRILCYAINFDIDEDISFESFSFKPKNAGNFIDRFKNAEQAWKTKQHGMQLKCKYELYRILYDMQQEYISGYIPKSKYEIIKPAVDYIHKKYTEELLNIADLSDMCKVTPEYFRSIFKSFYGVSPLCYINNLKITHAKELLETGLFSVTEAAIRSGYNDMSHFSREFKKTTGICPSEYLKGLS